MDNKKNKLFVTNCDSKVSNCHCQRYIVAENYEQAYDIGVKHFRKQSCYRDCQGQTRLQVVDNILGYNIIAIKEGN